MKKVNDIENLFRANYRRLYLLAKAILHDDECANDMVHDVFASLLGTQQQDTADDNDVTAAYLAAAVRNRCLNHLRDIGTRERIAGLYFAENKDYDDEKWPDDETIARIYRIIRDELTPQGRRVMELRFVNGLTFAKVARELCISENAVYKHVRQALVTIRKKLKNYG